LISTGSKRFSFIVMTLALGLYMAGCGASSPSLVTAESTPSPQAAPTTQPSPTSTLTSTPTPVTPSPTSSPTITSTPSQTPSPSATATETSPPPTASGEDAVYFYLVQLDTDGPVACGDSLVRINTGLWRTGDVENDVTTALRSLFVKQQYFGALYNPAYLSNIRVDSVSFKPYSGLVDVRLSGAYVRSGDRCDDSRVRAQVWSTIRQFPEVKTVYILLNGNLLGDILATGK
jgi:hypothetical protein